MTAILRVIRVSVEFVCPLSQILFITLMGRISRHSQRDAGIHSGGLGVMLLL